MSRKCDFCNKGPVFGNNISHSHRKTRRRWEPNLKTIEILINGKIQRKKICMKCYHAGKADLYLYK